MGKSYPHDMTMLIEQPIKLYSKDTIKEEFDGMMWKDIAKSICEDNDFELVDIKPSETPVNTNTMAFATGNAIDFSFKEKGKDQVRYGFIYLRFERDMQFIEATERDTT